jgi:short-subunit dehydrogenase
MALCPGSTKTSFFSNAGIERPIQVKGQQTVDDVIETAMAALDGHKAKVVSGWVNYLSAAATNLVPNSLITRVVGKALRSKYQQET